MALLLPILVALAFGVADLARGYALSVDVSGQAQAGVRALASSTNGALPATEAGCTYSTPSPYPTPPYFGSITVTYTCTFSPITPFLQSIIGKPKVVSTAVGRTQW